MVREKTMAGDDDPVKRALEKAAQRASRIADMNGAGLDVLSADAEEAAKQPGRTKGGVEHCFLSLVG